MANLRTIDDDAVKAWLGAIEANAFAPATKAVFAPAWASDWIGPPSGFDLSPYLARIDRHPVVSVALRWLHLNASQPEVVIGRQDRDGGYTPTKGHPLLDRLAHPNPQQSASAFLGATVEDLALGNALWVKASPGRDRSADVTELWWVPWRCVSWTLEDDRPLIRTYTVQGANGRSKDYTPDQVVHFRLGLDPVEPWLGLRRLQHQARSLAAMVDGERYNGAAVRNGHNGTVLTPKEAVNGVGILANTPEEAQMNALASSIRRETSGEAVGGLTKSSLPVDLLRIGGSPEEMGLSRILDRFEGMILAALGLNAHVLALPSSAETRTYANSAEYYKQAWQSGLLPLLTAIAEGIQTSLLPDYGDGADRCWFDASEVEALQESADARATRAVGGWSGDVLTLDEARDLFGVPLLGPKRGGDMRLSEQGMAHAQALAEQGMAPPGQQQDQDQDQEQEADPNAPEEGDDEELATKGLRFWKKKPKEGEHGAADRKPGKGPGTARGHGSGKPPKDGDHDGRIYDGTAQEQPAPGGAARFDKTQGEQAERFLEEHYGGYIAGAPEAQRQALGAYRNVTSDEWNGHLRHGRKLDPDGKAGVANLRKMIASAPPLPRPAVVYRGIEVGSSKLDPSTWAKGTVIKDAGFASTSLDPKVGGGWTTKQGVTLRVTLPRGTRAIAPDGNPARKSNLREREILLDAGSSLRVDRVRRTRHGGYVVVATYVGEGG